MLLKDIERSDFNLYFAGCFSYLKEEKTAIIINEMSINERGKGTVLFSPINGKVKNLGIDYVEDRISFTSPDLGTINLPSSVVFLYRVSIDRHPYKYQRLLSQQTLKVFDPFKKERELLRSPPVINSKDEVILNSWVNNVYVPAQEALDNVLRFKRIAQAFSKEYYFGINYKNNSVCLYKNRFIIGKVDPETRIINIKPSAISLKESLFEFGLNIKELNK